MVDNNPICLYDNNIIWQLTLSYNYPAKLANAFPAGKFQIETKSQIRKDNIMTSSEKNTSGNSPYRAFTTAQMTLTAIMAAILCILGPLSIPIPVSPVPITLTNLAIYFSVCILGWKLGTVSYLIYLAIGLVGLPVFSSFGSGFGKLLGPTGGYLIGFIFMALICGLFFEKCSSKALLFLGLVLGSLVNYAFGTAWLAAQANLTFSQALWAGVIPYLPADLIKILLAVWLAPGLRRKVFRGTGTLVA